MTRLAFSWKRVRPDVGEVIIMKDRMLSMGAHDMLRRSN
jgi:hypothetical protein